LDQPVEANTVKNVLKGDPICEFEVFLPEEVVEGLD